MGWLMGEEKAIPCPFILWPVSQITRARARSQELEPKLKELEPKLKKLEPTKLRWRCGQEKLELSLSEMTARWSLPPDHGKGQYI